MSLIAENYIKSLQKRQEALDKFTARRTAFLISKDLIMKEIEDARKILQTTFELLPKPKFEL